MSDIKKEDGSPDSDATIVKKKEFIKKLCLLYQ